MPAASGPLHVKPKKTSFRQTPAGQAAHRIAKGGIFGALGNNAEPIYSARERAQEHTRQAERHVERHAVAPYIPRLAHPTGAQRGAAAAITARGLRNMGITTPEQIRALPSQQLERVHRGIGYARTAERNVNIQRALQAIRAAHTPSILARSLAIEGIQDATDPTRQLGREARQLGIHSIMDRTLQGRLQEVTQAGLAQHEPVRRELAQMGKELDTHTRAQVLAGHAPQLALMGYNVTLPKGVAEAAGEVGSRLAGNPLAAALHAPTQLWEEGMKTKGALGFIERASGDYLNLYAQAIPAAVSMFQHPKETVQGMEDILAHPKESLREHPAIFAALLHGSVSALGRGAGAATRLATAGRGLEVVDEAGQAVGRLPSHGATYTRPSLLSPTGTAIPRRYSKDIIRKQVQKAWDRYAYSDQARGRLGFKGGVRRHALQRAEKKAVDQIYGNYQNVSRAERRGIESVMATVMPKHMSGLVDLVNEGTVRNPETVRADLEREVARLEHERANLPADTGAHILDANEHSIEALHELLDSPKLDNPAALKRVFRAARVYATVKGRQDEALAALGHLNPEQAAKRVLMPYALRWMEGRVDHTARESARGAVLREATVAEKRAGKSLGKTLRLRETARRREQRELGRSEVAVAHADQAAVKGERFVKATRRVHLKKLAEEQKAKRAVEALHAEGAPQAKIDAATARWHTLLNERERTREVHRTAVETAGERITQPGGRQRAQPFEAKTGAEHEVQTPATGIEGASPELATAAARSVRSKTLDVRAAEEHAWNLDREHAFYRNAGNPKGAHIWREGGKDFERVMGSRFAGSYHINKDGKEYVLTHHPLERDTTELGRFARQREAKAAAVEHAGEYGQRVAGDITKHALHLQTERERLAALHEEHPEVPREVHHEEFNKAFDKALANPEMAPFLHRYTDAERAEMRNFTSHDGKVGASLKPDGDIVSVFNLGPKGAGADLVNHVIAEGGSKLDAFAAGLEKYYAKLGFKEVSRDPWNEEYRPDGWDEAANGTPDVAYMEYSGVRAHARTAADARTGAREAKRRADARAGDEPSGGGVSSGGTAVRNRPAQRSRSSRRAGAAYGESIPREPLLPALGTKPTGRLRALEKASARVQELDVLRNRQAAELVARTKERKAAFVPKADRTYIPGLVDAHGNPLSREEVLAHAEAAGVDPKNLAYLTHRDNALGARAGYRGLEKHPYEGRYTFTGESTLKGLHERGYLALAETAMRGQRIIDAISSRRDLINHFVRPAATDANTGRKVWFKDYSKADEQAKNLKAMTGEDWVPYLIADARMDNERLAVLKEHLNDSTLTEADRNLAAEQDIEAIMSPSSGAVLERSDLQGIRDLPGNQWGLIRRDVAKRLRQHESFAGKTAVEHGFQRFTQTWRTAILHGSSVFRWTFGNLAEMALRIGVAGAGPRSYLIGHRILGEIDKALITNQIDRARWARIRDNILSGGHFTGTQKLAVRTAMRESDVDFVNQWRKAANGRAPSAITGLWHSWVNLVDKVNKSAEQMASTAAIGKLATADREAYGAFGRSWKDTLGMGEKAIEDVAQGLLETPNQVRYAQHVHKVLGQYANLSPSARYLVTTYTPFGLWYANALKFLFLTLPRDHPLFLAGMGLNVAATQEDRIKHGEDLYLGTPDGGSHLPPWLQGTAFFPGAGQVNLSHYTPFSAAAEPFSTAGSQVLPQAWNFLMAAMGKDWKGSDLYSHNGSKVDDDRARLLYAAYTTLQSMVPFLSVAQQVREKGGKPYAESTIFKPYTKQGTQKGYTYALKRFVNPLAPYQQGAQASSGGSHTSVLPGLPSLPSLPTP